jgi:hypothetical protein
VTRDRTYSDRQAERVMLAAMPELANRDDEGEQLSNVIATGRLLEALKEHHRPAEVLSYAL